MQAHSNSLQFFSLSEMAKHPTDPAAALGGAKVCTTPLFCTKKGHKARRREGDKWFFSTFFLQQGLHQQPLLLFPEQGVERRLGRSETCDGLDFLKNTVYLYSMCITTLYSRTPTCHSWVDALVNSGCYGRNQNDAKPSYLLRYCRLICRICAPFYDIGLRM